MEGLTVFLIGVGVEVDCKCTEGLDGRSLWVLVTLILAEPEMGVLLEGCRGTSGNARRESTTGLGERRTSRSRAGHLCFYCLSLPLSLSCPTTPIPSFLLLSGPLLYVYLKTFSGSMVFNTNSQPERAAWSPVPTPHPQHLTEALRGPGTAWLLQGQVQLTLPGAGVHSWAPECRQ